MKHIKAAPAPTKQRSPSLTIRRSLTRRSSIRQAAVPPPSPTKHVKATPAPMKLQCIQSAHITRKIFRLFSCGTSKEGDSHLVEWNETKGAIKRTYSGFRKRSLGVVQFDTTRNRFQAAGDEFQIKFWDMENASMLTAVDADGGLPASPRLRFNEEGSLLAVTTSDNGIKVLANTDGMSLIRMLKSRAFEKNRALPDTSKGPSNSFQHPRMKESNDFEGIDNARLHHNLLGGGR